MGTPEPAIGWRTSSHSAGNGNCVEVGWRTSSHSAGNGGCVEVGWRTSSHSAGHGDCVEVRDAPSEVHVRDTKNRDGGQLRFPRPGWDAFLAAVRRA